MIIPAKVIGNMSYKRVTHDEQNSSIVLQMFPDPAGAMKWLESCIGAWATWRCRNCLMRRLAEVGGALTAVAAGDLD